MTQLQGSNLAFSDLIQSASLGKQLAAAPYCFSNKRELGFPHRVNFLRSWRLLSGMQKAIPGFNPSEYANLRGLDSSVDSTLHFLTNGSPSGPWLRKVIVSDSTASSATNTLSVALHIHVYYLELLSPIMGALQTNKARPDLLVTTPDHKMASEIQKILADYTGNTAVIPLGDNIGRDLGPFFSHLPSSFFSDFQVIGHLHTKKSEAHSTLRGVKGWFEFCVGNTLGTSESPGMLDRILEAFASNENLGIVYPDDPHVMGWTENYRAATQLFDANKLPGEEELFDFPIGSFFLARPHALKPLLDLKLTDGSYPQEPVPYDGTTLHALERLIGIIPKQMGYETAVTFVSSLYR